MTLSFDEHIRQAQLSLECAAADLTEEMRTYPTPISGCDAQYIHLVAERNKVSAALYALKTPVFVATPRTPYAGAGVESR